MDHMIVRIFQGKAVTSIDEDLSCRLVCNPDDGSCRQDVTEDEFDNLVPWHEAGRDELRISVLTAGGLDHQDGILEPEVTSSGWEGYVVQSDVVAPLGEGAGEQVPEVGCILDLPAID